MTALLLAAVNSREDCDGVRAPACRHASRWPGAREIEELGGKEMEQVDFLCTLRYKTKPGSRYG
jgi:hypothetical protein